MSTGRCARAVRPAWLDLPGFLGLLGILALLGLVVLFPGKAPGTGAADGGLLPGHRIVTF